MMAVNAAVTLGRPLLIKGEPGTGKTQLAAEIARALQRPLYEWHIKSTSKAHQGLYEYDAVSRLRDSQLGEEKVHDIRNYIMKGSLWEAFESDVQPVLLIDEIDKADIEFPNDLLRELDRMEFFVHETRELVKARHRPDHPHHQQQREGAAGCVPAPLLLPLHPLSGCGDDGEDRARALPGSEDGAAARGAHVLLQRARDAGTAQEAFDLRAARLDQTTARRGHPARSAARRRSEEADPGRCTARCSRTSRTCTCSSSSCSSIAARAAERRARC